MTIARSAVCVVQGASRGLGLQFCNTLLNRRGTQVIATCRQPEKSEGLQRLKEQFPQDLSVLQLDVTNETTISAAASDVSSRYGKVDLLINCAGILHPSGRGETSLKAVTAEGLETTLMTNTIGPLMMVKHFLPMLTKGEGAIGKQAAEPSSQHASVIVNMSAKVSSITDNGLGGWYSYRMSKAALNMATKNLSIELGRGKNKIICISLHPGTVDTELTKPYHKNIPKLFTTEESVGKMLSVVDSLSIGDSGKFFLYSGEVMPF